VYRVGPCKAICERAACTDTGAFPSDMGVLQVELIDAKGLHGSDRSGKSDVSGISSFGLAIYDYALNPHKYTTTAFRLIQLEWRKGLQISSQEEDPGSCVGRTIRGAHSVAMGFEPDVRGV